MIGVFLPLSANTNVAPKFGRFSKAEDNASSAPIRPATRSAPRPKSSEPFSIPWSIAPDILGPITPEILREASIPSGKVLFVTLSIVLRGTSKSTSARFAPSNICLFIAFGELLYSPTASTYFWAAYSCSSFLVGNSGVGTLLLTPFILNSSSASNRAKFA